VTSERGSGDPSTAAMESVFFLTSSAVPTPVSFCARSYQGMLVVNACIIIDRIVRLVE